MTTEKAPSGRTYTSTRTRMSLEAKVASTEKLFNHLSKIRKRLAEGTTVFPDGSRATPEIGSFSSALAVNRRPPMVNLVKTDTALRIEPNDIGALASAQTIEEALEYHLCNGWEIIAPEECGALTDGLILTDNATRNGDGQVVALGRVYWDSNYQITNALEELQQGRTVEFIAVD